MTMEEQKFQVIGCGLSRTGTTSLREALQILLDGPCYHACNITEDTDNPLMSFWIDVMKGNISDQQIRNMMRNKGFIGGLDLPVANLYKRLMKVYPDAKLILTVRDRDAWYKSFKINISDPMQGVLDSLLKRYFFYLLGKPRSPEFYQFTLAESCEAFYESKEEAIKYYDRWLEEVKETVPADRLLVYDVRQGWEPLCKFLGKPIPHQEFPHLNDTQRLQERLKRYKRYFMLGVFSSITVCTVASATLVSYML